MFKYLLLALALPFYNHITAYSSVTAVSTTYTSTYSSTLTTTYTSTLTTTYTSTLTTTVENTLPIVVLHGIASNYKNMGNFSDWLACTFQRPVFNVEIGNGKQNSLFMPLDKQLSLLCDTLYKIQELQKGFDFIGMSQGGLLARGYVERCNKYPVRNLINMVSPNGGVVLPTNIDMYEPFYQKHLAFSGYWRDPTDLLKYFANCSYLPSVNNERLTEFSTQYKANILSLANFVVIWSPNDEVLTPPESGKFSVFDVNYTIIPLEETPLYLHDLLGLRALAEREQLGIYETNCTHVDHNAPACFDQLYAIFKTYL